MGMLSLYTRLICVYVYLVHGKNDRLLRSAAGSQALDEQPSYSTAYGKYYMIARVDNTMHSREVKW